ncbi:MAG: ABC transporter permease subunit [Bacillota bacterium]
MTLLWQQFRAQLMGLLAWTGAGLLLVLSQVKAAPATIDSGMSMFEKLPDQLKRMMGVDPNLSALDNFVAGKVATTLALLLVLYAVVLALSVVTREVDRRTIDFLLSLPVTRSEVLLTRAGVMILNTGLAGAILWGATIGGLQGQNLEGDYAGYWQLFLAQWLLAVMVGSVTLLASLWIDDYSLGIKLFIGLLSSLYFLEFALKGAGVGRVGRLISPFSYADPATVIGRGLPPGEALFLVLTSLAALGACLPVFQRKQISA